MKSTKAIAGVAVGLVLLLGAGGAGAQDWPQWRGPNRDNKVKGFTEPKTWPKELTRKWKVSVGLGDASPVLVGDKLYAFTRQGGDEVILCLDAGSGKELWKDKYPAVAVTRPADRHPGPRSTPAVADGKVCTLGVGGVLSCLDAGSGQVVWRKDTKGRPQFFTSASPIIVDGKCVASLGGDRGGDIAAYDLAGGEEKWRRSDDGVAYGSPVLMTVGGTPIIVAPTKRSLVGINPADGKLLWQAAFLSRYNSATPVISGDEVIYSAADGGTAAYKVEKKADGFTAEPLWKKKSAAGVYNTPVLKDGLLFGLEGGNRSPAYFFCMDAKDGEVRWKDTTRRGECGEILDAGPVLLALTSDSQLVVIKPDGKEYKELARYKVADTETWAYPVIAGNRVFVKDRDALTLWTIE
jgi:outer membrane protein assembly factor BamB